MNFLWMWMIKNNVAYQIYLIVCLYFMDPVLSNFLNASKNMWKLREDKNPLWLIVNLLGLLESENWFRFYVLSHSATLPWKKRRKVKWIWNIIFFWWLWALGSNLFILQMKLEIQFNIEKEKICILCCFYTFFHTQFLLSLRPYSLI